MSAFTTNTKPSFATGVKVSLTPISSACACCSFEIGTEKIRSVSPFSRLPNAIWVFVWFTSSFASAHFIPRSFAFIPVSRGIALVEPSIVGSSPSHIELGYLGVGSGSVGVASGVVDAVVTAVVVAVVSGAETVDASVSEGSLVVLPLQEQSKNMEQRVSAKSRFIQSS